MGLQNHVAVKIILKEKHPLISVCRFFRVKVKKFKIVTIKNFTECLALHEMFGEKIKRGK